MAGLPGVSSVDLLGALSLATDLGTGQPLEHGIRTCVVAYGLARGANLPAGDAADAYLTVLLHSLGCTSDAYETAAVFGNDIDVRLTYATVDPAQPREMLTFSAGVTGADSPIAARIGTSRATRPCWRAATEHRWRGMRYVAGQEARTTPTSWACSRTRCWSRRRRRPGRTSSASTPPRSAP